MVNKSDTVVFIMIFIGVIIAINFLVPISDQIALNSRTITITNNTVTAPEVNETLDLIGRELINSIEIYNASNLTPGITGAFLSTKLGSAGLLTVQLTLNDSAATFAGQDINVSYTANPDGYLSSGATRSINNLNILFGALAILILILVMLIKDGVSFGELVRFGK